MAYDKKNLESLLAKLEDIAGKSNALEEKHADELQTLHPKYIESARNMLHYLGLRQVDIRLLQQKLGELGITRLGRAESHVMASLIAANNILKRLINSQKRDPLTSYITIPQGLQLVRSNTTSLLGKKLKGSKVRIMVTLPTEAAKDKKLIYSLLSSGMNSARINCAHDDADTWKKMIEKIHKAKNKTGRNCKICMDLGGPKLRTGLMKPGPKVIHIQPERDSLGRITSPSLVWIAAAGRTLAQDDRIYLPVGKNWVKKLKKGDVIAFIDSRGKKCNLKVEAKEANGRWARCNDSAYIQSGMKLVIQKKKKKKSPLTTKVGALLPIEQKIVLRIGDKLILHKDPRPGEPAQIDQNGNIKKPAHISCTLSEVFTDVRPGEPILLDDGKLEGTIHSVHEDEMVVEITYAKEKGTNLRGDKGINLPGSNLQMSGLTDKDREDLKFVVKHADIVNFSFVNSPQDVMELLEELNNLNARNLGIILKIETQQGYKNLPGILLTAMRSHPLGVMIARGDLAIEGGWKHLAQIQEEILWLCEAAHIPIVWATQVLETLAKKGRPSRAEITDAAMAQRAECVMLNKGPHIIEAIRMLDEIMRSMEDYHQKKAPILPKLESTDTLEFGQS
jgi:pyruvate kinase